MTRSAAPHERPSGLHVVVEHRTMGQQIVRRPYDPEPQASCDSEHQREPQPACSSHGVEPAASGPPEGEGPMNVKDGVPTEAVRKELERQRQ